MDSKRIAWLDGIKGLACIGVMWHHFTLAFLPLLYSDDFSSLYTASDMDKKLQQSPFLFWINGNYMVMLFLTISGIVLCKKVAELEDSGTLPEIIIKRYYRLMLPFVPMAVITYVFIKCGWFGNYEASLISGSTWLATCCTNQMSFLQFICETLAGAWFAGSVLSSVLWMMPALFKGTFLVIILSIISWKAKPWKALLIYVFLAGAMALYSPLYAPLCLGVAFYICYQNYGQWFGMKYIGILSLIIGCFLGGYPTGVQPTNVYRYLNFLPEFIDTRSLWHMGGAILTIYGVACLPIAQKFLSGKFAIFLGKISYSVYLWHSFILCTVSSYVYVFLGRLGCRRSMMLAVTFLITNVVVIGFTYFYSKYFEKGSENLARKAVRFFIS